MASVNTQKGFKRIILDIKDILNDPIENIYYFPDEDNITIGYALIIGPQDTPYQFGNYFFKFIFDEYKYPFSPPEVKFLSNNGITRFNPNLYKNGKVCLSILNTWEGEPWSSCQSLRTVLITIQSILNENPLLNEPGIYMNKHSNSIKTYNEIIEYENLNFTIHTYLNNISLIPLPEIFHDNIHSIMLEKYHENKNKIMEFINNKIMVFKTNVTLMIPIYRGDVLIDYNLLKNKFSELI